MAASKPTACILCECNCGILAEIGGEGGHHLVKLRGDKDHPSSRGYACEKAHRLDHYQHARDRITRPLRRRADGTFEEIDWDTAIREVAARLAKVRDTHGGDTIFYYGGGGQGNHLPGAYSTSTRRALGSRYRSSALAQEKTGEFWVSDRMFGNMTRADFEHCDVGLFLGKNPWHSHSIPRARVTLKEISADPARTLIVIDPRRTETAELADIHLQVRPGEDAALLCALLSVIATEDLVDRAFLSAHVTGTEPVLAALAKIPFERACARAGVSEELVKNAARAIGRAKAFASFEDLGVQMNVRSTLVSYLHKLLVFCTGSFGKKGSHYVPTTMVSLIGGESSRKSPVAGARIIAGLIPCNVIADEILTDHPKRYRAMIIEAANPAHSLADSKRFREALAALECVVTIDVAMSESAKLSHYVLPAATQFEKAEATFFNFDFPENYFHLRRRLFAPPEGPLPEAEIHARIAEALGVITEADCAPLRAAMKSGLEAYAATFMATVMPNARLSGAAPAVLYRTVDLPEDAKEGAVLLGAALRAAMEHGEPLARAGFGGSPLEAALSLFRKIVDSPSGVVFAIDDWASVTKRVSTSGGKIQLDLPDLREELESLFTSEGAATNGMPDAADFPLVLSAGERRSFTANTIIRDPAWRKKDAEGALRMSPADAARIGVDSGDDVRLVTKRGSAIVTVEVTDTMQTGHVSLPNGLGLAYPTAEGSKTAGVAPNELTSIEDRDPYVGTPWHKHVAARVEPVAKSSRG
jgi:formate dehydrogenase